MIDISIISSMKREKGKTGLGLALFFVFFIAADAITEEISFAATCSSTKYFDISSLECRLCDDGSDAHFGKTPDFSSRDVYGNALRCKCDKGFQIVPRSCSLSEGLNGMCNSFTCVTCGISSKASYLDGSACTSCDSSTAGFSTTLEDCSCSVTVADYDSKVLLETTAAGEKISPKECATCPAGKFVAVTNGVYAGEAYSSDLYSCQSCPDREMEFNSGTGSCDCKTGYLKLGVASMGKQSCVREDIYTTVSVIYSPASAKVVRYYALQKHSSGAASYTSKVESAIFDHYFGWASTSCYGFSGPSSDSLVACQVLANLCVLQLYDEQATACKLYSYLEGIRQQSHSQNGWPATLPWLYYKDRGDMVTSDTTIGMKMSFKPVNGYTHLLSYYLSRYDLNGTWLGMEPLDTQLFYCKRKSPNTGSGGGTSQSTAWLNFGRSEEIKFSCDLDTLVSSMHKGEGPYFYDMYVRDTSTGEYFPVPVNIYNFRDRSGTYPNMNELRQDEDDDRYTRRFFLYDTYSGINGEQPNADGKFSPVIVRYASEISLRTSIQTRDPEKIYPPVLEIKYMERTLDSILNNQAMAEDEMNFTVEYTMNTESFWQNIQIAIGVFGVLAGILWLTRIRHWQARNQRPQVYMDQSIPVSAFNSKYLATCAVLGLHSFVVVFFPVTFAITCYWFLFFKLQANVFLMLPPDIADYGSYNEYYGFKFVINLLFFFQLAYILFIVYVQTQADIFFVDWEKPRNPGKSEFVSSWRLINIANEWNEMQSQRWTSITFNLLGIVFILQGLNLQCNAANHPSGLGQASSCEVNAVLGFANTTSWWLILSFGQMAWNYYIYERYITEPRSQKFVDLSTIAKVSMFILDERYHGWYLHCRSPYPFADGTMPEILEQLKKEESGLTVDRSLEGAPKDVQVFEIFVTESWRKKYDKVYTKLSERNNEMLAKKMGRMTESGAGTRGRPRRSSDNGNHSGEVSSMETLTKGIKVLGQFLQDFVDQNFSQKDLRRTVREPQWFDQLLGVPPDISNDTGCILWPDRSSTSFTKATFLGREKELLIFNILTFSVCNIWFDNNIAVSAICTYFLDLIISYTRHALGGINISSKTLIDERFLI